MMQSDQEFVQRLVEQNRYMSLATTDGTNPWIAPLEYIADADLNLYFFSPENSLHAQHLTTQSRVAIAIFDADQPEFEPAPVLRLAGVQIEADATVLERPYPAIVEQQIETWGLSMPPYAAFKISPERWFLPEVRDGVNVRFEVKF